MCGIGGILDFRLDRRELGNALARMNKATEHRGPDGSGIQQWEHHNLGFCHQRLSIIDLRDVASQPMTSSCGRYSITFNGEIYNFQDLKVYLGPRLEQLRSSSDTEVLQELIAEIGVDAAVQKLNGMFAFAVWDHEDQTLTLVRDRVGVKPLIYAPLTNGGVVFGSELSAITASGLIEPELDLNSVANYLRFLHVPAPHTIYKGVFKLPAGTTVRFGPGISDQQPVPYWSLGDVISQRQVPMTFDQSVSELDQLLRDSVSRRMISDVPIGSFLSAGIDSTAVTAIMSQVSTTPVSTFTMGFDVEGFSEAAAARRIAEHLGTDHHEHIVTAKQALDLIPTMATVYDEPFADPSQIPTYLVSKFAKQKITVALSGDGGDELFGGYPIYYASRKFWNLARNLPYPVRSLAGSAFGAINPQAMNKLGQALPGLPRDLGNKLHKLGAMMRKRGELESHASLVSRWLHPESILRSETQSHSEFDDPALMNSGMDPTERLMYLTTKLQLPDQMLTKVDRASMRNGLEVRDPLLDYRVLQFAWQMPFDHKIQGMTGKRVLRKLVSQYVPDELMSQPKWGFSPPLDDWLRGPLRPWVEELLCVHNLESTGIFDPKPVRKVWEDHHAGRRNAQLQVWPIIMLQAWLQQQSSVAAESIKLAA